MSARRAALLLAMAASAAAFSGCAGSPAGRSEVEHVVLVWLKQPGDAATKALLCETARSFVGTIPGLVSVDCGDPLEIASPVHDQTFDVACVMRFCDAAALTAYETHPVHAAAKRDVLLPNAARVVVHDVLLR